jgi:amino acid permease
MENPSTEAITGRRIESAAGQPQEHSPLLLDTASSVSSYYEDEDGNMPYHHGTSYSDIQSMISQKGTASARDVGINLAKTAAGTGILALPYACKEGGLLLFVFGTVLVSIWNVYGVARLCDCLDLIGRGGAAANKGHSCVLRRPPPPGGTATLGKVAYYALGDVGLVVLDVMLLILLTGIVIAYEVAILAFARGTPFSTGRTPVDAVILAVLLVPLCIVDDMSNLSRLSRLGLVILGFTMLVISGYGVSGRHGYDGDIADGTVVPNSPFTLFPPNGLAGVSHWFGCVVFGFGIVPLTFNFRESMAKPDQLPVTALTSMLLVAAAYIVTGIGLLYLYPDIDDDVLSQIPDGGLATVTRLAMVAVVMATAPLLIVPCAEIIEGKIHHDGRVHHRTRVLARTGLCLSTVGVSVMVPGFVAVLSFVGCFSVALVSFGVPPFLHYVLLLVTYPSHDEEHGDAGVSEAAALARGASLASDLVLCFFGIATSVVTTWITFRKMLLEEAAPE